MSTASGSRAERRPRVAIIGAGFSGICLGIRLRARGIESFTIFEKAHGPGGTWRANTYPGAACDTPSFAYCFSFEQKTDWSRKWAPQPEILAYLEHCVRTYGLDSHIRYGWEVEEARYDAGTGTWRLRTMRGDESVADVLVCAVGQLDRPHVPNVPGLGEFEGEWFHSARWSHDVGLEGKRVAVVGNAASAVQIVPEIAPRVASLHVFQRSANWILPQRNRAFRDWERRLFSRLPLLARLYRWWIWAAFESRFPVFRNNRLLARLLEKAARDHLRSQVADPEMRSALTPDYPIGGKRVLISDAYYPALARDNVRLVTDSIERIARHGVVTVTGEVIPTEVLVFATGFESTAFLAPMRIQGRDGASLGDVWGGAARAYLGMTVAGFPNLFLMYGPSTNLGHNSIVFMIECQTRYVLGCLREMRRRGLASIEVRREVMERFDAELRASLAGTVWARAERSWYKTDDGTITNNWPGSTVAYWWRTLRPDLDEYLRVPAGVCATAPLGTSPAKGT